MSILLREQKNGNRIVVSGQARLSLGRKKQQSKLYFMMQCSTCPYILVSISCGQSCMTRRSFELASV